MEIFILSTFAIFKSPLMDRMQHVLLFVKITPKPLKVWQHNGSKEGRLILRGNFHWNLSQHHLKLTHRHCPGKSITTSQDGRRRIMLSKYLSKHTLTQFKIEIVIKSVTILFLVSVYDRTHKISKLHFFSFFYFLVIFCEWPRRIITSRFIGGLFSSSFRGKLSEWDNDFFKSYNTFQFNALWHIYLSLLNIRGQTAFCVFSDLY